MANMTCFTDWKFVRANDYRRAGGLLKYLQYRDDAVNHLPRAGGPDRWVNCGLGENWREILDTAAEFQAKEVLLRSLVIRPPQELVAQLQSIDPERWADRRDLLEELVHQVMDAEMERRGIAGPDGRRQPIEVAYSYVIHAHDDERGIESPHAHVITAASDFSHEQPFMIYQKKGDHLKTRLAAERECERLFGLDRVRAMTPDLQLGEHEEREPVPDRDIPFHQPPAPTHPEGAPPTPTGEAAE